MTTTRYLGSITPPPPSISVIGSGGTISSNIGLRYFWLVNRCVGGFTKASITSTSATITANCQVEITIPSSARTTGSDIREFYVLANTVNDSSTASIIASYPGFFLTASAQTPSDYSETPTTLPAVITISTDEQLELSASVPDLSSLPTGGDLVHGMGRLVGGDGGDNIYTYISNAPLDDWYILTPQTFNPDVSNASDPGGYGCDRDVRAIPAIDRDQIIYPAYDAIGVSRAAPVLIANTGSGSSISTGKTVEVTASVGNTDLTKYLRLTPRGIVNLTTGILDVSGQPSIGGSFPADGEGSSVIGLEKDLAVGEGFWFDMRLEFSPEDTAGTLVSGSYVTFDAAFSPFNAKQTPDAGLFGDLIGPVAGYGRVIPNGVGLTPVITSRTGKIRGYTFPPYGGVLGQQDIAGVQSNTANQNVVVTNNGIAYVAATTPSTASLRAIISTEDGIGSATAFSGSYVVDSTKQLRLTITNPTTVRPDYPDILGVKQQAATLNASAVRVYTRPIGGGTITYFDKTILGTVSEEITIGDVASGTIGSLPAVDADFGLFTVEGVSGTVITGSSIFASTTVEVAIAYIYSGTVTRITHDPVTLETEATAQGDATRYVREASSSLWDLFALRDAIGNPLPSVTDAEALSKAEVAVDKLFFIRETRKIYHWDAASIDAPDRNRVIQLTGTTIGRLISVSGTGGGLETEIVTTALTVDSQISKQYFIEASGASTTTTITLPLASGAFSGLKHQFIRKGNVDGDIKVVCSGGDSINNGEATFFRLGFGEVVDISVNPDLGGYLVTGLQSSSDIENKRSKIKNFLELYVSPTGNDNNSGLSSPDALKTISGVSRRVKNIDLNGWYINIFLEPGAEILVSENLYEGVDIVGMNSSSEANSSYYEFYGDSLNPPKLVFGEYQRITLSGEGIYYGFYDIDLLVDGDNYFSGQGLINTSTYLHTRTYLNIVSMSVERSLGSTGVPYSVFYGDGYGGGEPVIYVDGITTSFTVPRLAEIKKGYCYFRNLDLHGFSSEIFKGKNAHYEIGTGGVFTLTNASPQYSLTSNSFFETNGVTIPGTLGTLERGSTTDTETNPVGGMYVIGNATATTIGTINIPVKAAGATTANGINRFFTHSNNRLTYSGNRSETFQVNCSVKISGTASENIGVILYKNGSSLPDSETTVALPASGTSDPFSLQSLTSLAENDYIEVWVVNKTSTNNVTVIDLNCITRLA